MDLNVIAGQLDEAFREWSSLEPLIHRPKFLSGLKNVDRGQPRFGVVQETRSSIISIDLAYEDVSAAIVLREIIATFIPTTCLVDVTWDAINQFCGYFLTQIIPGQLGSQAIEKWQTIVNAHSRKYFVHYLGAPITLDLRLWYINSKFFHTLLDKLRWHAPLIPDDQASDIITIIVNSILYLLWERTYTSKDAEFIALVSSFMGTHRNFPFPKYLAKIKPGWTRRRCEDAARHLEKDPISPTYYLNPGVLGLVLCWVLLESHPTVSNFTIRHLVFLPFASMSFSQCVGTPLPTYFATYFLPPTQLDELRAHFGELKQAGILLDYQIFRAERSLDILNWNETLAVSSPIPLVSTAVFDLGLDIHSHTELTKMWQQSWIVQQSLQSFGVRKFTPRALTHFNPINNYKSFLSIVEDTALLATSNLGKDLAMAMPLLERYRNVEYVIHLIELTLEIFRHFIDQPESLTQNHKDFGKLELIWSRYPARDWLQECLRKYKEETTHEVSLFDELTFTARLLHFFAPFTIRSEKSILKFLHEKQQHLIEAIKEDLKQLPSGEKERFQYFTELHNKIVYNQLLVPRIGISPIFRPSVEEFFLFARSPHSWKELVEGFIAKFPAIVHNFSLMQFRDETGGLIVAGFIRATHTQFRSIRRTLVGTNGILGSGASLLIGRRVPFWDLYRRNFLETFDQTTKSYASIKDYLTLMRSTYLAEWTQPRIQPLPYSRKILIEPYLGSVERLTRSPPNQVQLTPHLVSSLKASYISGKSSLHHLVARRLQVYQDCDLNWPAYGLERFFLHVYLSTRQPKYIYTHLITPATRRVLVSSAVSGFQTVIIEYLWPKGAPDDKFLHYLYSRTEKNVLEYSVHRARSDTPFFNLDKVWSREEIKELDTVDLRVFMLARPSKSRRLQEQEHFYGEEIKYLANTPPWEVAVDYFNDHKKTIPKVLPPDSRPIFRFDPRTVGFSEKVALVFRGDFDALPVCRSLPFGHYYRTEEINYSTTKRLEGQPGHLIIFDIPPLQMSQLNAFLDDILRDPAVRAHSVASFLIEQNLSLIQGVALARVNPLRANPYDFVGEHYIHLPKRQLRDGKWYTLSLKDQVKLLNNIWSSID